MRPVLAPMVQDANLQHWMETVTQGLQGTLSPHNLHATARRQSLPFRLGSLTGGETFRLYASRQKVFLEAVILTSSTSTMASNAANNWRFQLTVGNVSVNGSGISTTTIEIEADKQYDLGVAADRKLEISNVLKLTVIKTGTPTSLATATVEAHVVVQLLE